MAPPPCKLPILVFEYGWIDHFVSQASTQASCHYRGNGSQDIPEIDEVTRTGRAYKPEGLADIEERKRKAKDILTDESQKKKKVIEDETLEF